MPMSMKSSYDTRGKLLRNLETSDSSICLHSVTDSFNFTGGEFQEIYDKFHHTKKLGLLRHVGLDSSTAAATATAETTSKSKISEICQKF